MCKETPIPLEGTARVNPSSKNRLDDGAAEYRISGTGPRTAGYLYSILRRRKIATPILPQSREILQGKSQNIRARWTHSDDKGNSEAASDGGVETKEHESDTSRTRAGHEPDTGMVTGGSFGRGFFSGNQQKKEIFERLKNILSTIQLHSKWSPTIAAFCNWWLEAVCNIL